MSISAEMIVGNVTVTEPAVDDASAPAAAGGAANGTLIKTRPAGATGIILDLSPGASITYAIATAQPTSPPATQPPVSGSAYPRWTEPLGPSTNLYVTAKSGTVMCRYI